MEAQQKYFLKAPESSPVLGPIRGGAAWCWQFQKPFCELQHCQCTTARLLPEMQLEESWQVEPEGILLGDSFARV